MAPKIIYEDESILVIDKPAGLVVDRSASQSENTLQNWLDKKLNINNLKSNKFIDRSGIVHRLDKETSGLLIIAKTPKSFENLQWQFKQRLVQKKYLALVHGLIEPATGEISAPISRSPFARKKFGVYLGGRPSLTKYQTIKHLHKGNYKFTFLELTPSTGRTHQIRVHLKHLGYPIVGDEKYAGRKVAKNDRRWCRRQFLHAKEISFTHPSTKKLMEFTSPLPPDLNLVLTNLSA